MSWEHTEAGGGGAAAGDAGPERPGWPKPLPPNPPLPGADDEPPVRQLVTVPTGPWGPAPRSDPPSAAAQGPGRLSVAGAASAGRPAGEDSNAPGVPAAPAGRSDAASAGTAAKVAAGWHGHLRSRRWPALAGTILVAAAAVVVGVLATGGSPHPVSTGEPGTGRGATPPPGTQAPPATGPTGPLRWHSAVVPVLTTVIGDLTVVSADLSHPSRVTQTTLQRDDTSISADLAVARSLPAPAQPATVTLWGRALADLASAESALASAAAPATPDPQAVRTADQAFQTAGNDLVEVAQVVGQQD